MTKPLRHFGWWCLAVTTPTTTHLRRATRTVGRPRAMDGATKTANALASLGMWVVPVVSDRSLLGGEMKKGERKERRDDGQWKLS